MKIIPFAAILLSALSAFPVFGNDEAGLQELFRRLDRAIAHSGEYAARREARIDSLKNELGREELPLRTCFDLTEQLADIYSSYQSDSSLLYFRRGLELAERIGDNDLTMRARSSIALCYSLGGRFYEAEEILNAISDTVSVSRRALQSYYVAQHRKNRELCYLTEPGARRDVFRLREHYYARRAAEIGEHRALGQFLFIRRVLERQPAQLVENVLPRVARPVGKETLWHLVAEPLVHKADDAVHVKVRLTV